MSAGAPPSGADDTAGPTTTAGRSPERLAVAFTRVARRAGLALPGDAAVRLAEALAAVGLARRSPVYWAGRATLVRRPEDVDAYDAVFAAFWLGSLAGMSLPLPATTLAVADDDGEEDPADGEAGNRPPAPVLHLRYSPTEVLRHKDFAECTPDELAEA
ncbi:MAG: hypothetical protein ACRDYZ_11280, partial [Acidimicrobiales bacterium]